MQDLKIAPKIGPQVDQDSGGSPHISNKQVIIPTKKQHFPRVYNHVDGCNHLLFILMIRRVYSSTSIMGAFKSDSFSSLERHLRPFL